MTKVKLILLVLLPALMLFASETSHGRYAAIMIDADNGKVLHEVDAGQSWYPASLTKLMTLYMAFEALKEGRLHSFDVMRTSGHAAAQPTSKLGLRAGEYITVRDAILAIITRSANDAAVVLAEHLGSTEENFAIKMTSKARSLGMSSTRFMNATGLPNDWQVTTSRDLAVLAWKLQRHFPDYYQQFSSQGFTFKGTELRGTNKFVARYPGAEGMKTGFTCGSGYNLIATAHQNGKRLIGVVLGGMTSDERYQLMYQMMDAGFANRYDGYGEPQLNSIPASFSGTPPHQLSCGNRASFHATRTPISKQRNFRSASNQRFISTNIKLGKKVSVGKHKLVFIPRKNNKFVLNTGLNKFKNTKQGLLIAMSTTSSKNFRSTPNKLITSRPALGNHNHRIVTSNITGNRTRYHHSNAR